MRFEDLTVYQYQELYRINRSPDIDEDDKKTLSVAVITGKTEREVEDMSLNEFRQLSSTVVEFLKKTELKYAPKRIIKAGGGRYNICYVPAQWTRGQYVTVQHFLKGDLVENAHLILASIADPVKNVGWWKVRVKGVSHEKIASDFLTAPFVDVYSACVFFCNVLKASIDSIRDFLKKEIEKKGMKADQLLEDLQKAMDGFIMPNVWQISKT